MQVDQPTLSKVKFAHPSEHFVAGVLDANGIRWDYEPFEFVLETDEMGRPTSAFRPDFFLPDWKLFLEVTTMNQKYVTSKNRKVRLLRELFPEVRIEVLYRRDVMSLVETIKGLQQERDEGFWI